MTLAEAAAHIGHPVLAREQPGRVRDGEITEVDEARQLVRVRLRRQYHPYDHTGYGWYSPCHLTIPRWWLDRQKTPNTQHAAPYAVTHLRRCEPCTLGDHPNTPHPVDTDTAPCNCHCTRSEKP